MSSNKMDVDYSETVAKAIPEAQEIAKQVRYGSETWGSLSLFELFFEYSKCKKRISTW